MRKSVPTLRRPERGLTPDRAGSRRSQVVTASWIARLVVWLVGVGGSAATAVYALVRDAPEVTLLCIVITIVAGYKLVHEATTPVRVLRDVLVAMASGRGVASEGLTLPATSAGVGGALIRALHTALVADEERAYEQAQRLSGLEAMVRHAGVALIAFEPDGRVVHSNDAARRLLGLPRLRTLHDIPDDLRGVREVLVAIGSGEAQLVEGVRDGKPFGVSVIGASYTSAGRVATLASLVDVRPVLEDREAEAWTALTRVLLHEIANSVAPIASLAETTTRRLDRGDARAAAEAAETIGRRAEGLVRFVEGYQAVARVPQPVRRPTSLADIVKDVACLLSIPALPITTSIEPPNVVAHVDPDLVEQALINLVRNALQAVGDTDDPRVSIDVFKDGSGLTSIRVTDNGPGIESEEMTRVFIPFYSTREGGSGIGLTLARRIAQLHKGRLEVVSIPGNTTLTLTLGG